MTVTAVSELSAGLADGTTTLGRMLDDATQAHAGREAIVIGDRRLTYAQLRDEADAFAAGLLELGIRPRDHVLLWLPNFAEAYVALFAVTKIGAVFGPVNPRLKARELAYMLESSDAKAIIGTPSLGKIDYEATLRQVLPDLPTVRHAQFPKLEHVISVRGDLPGARRYEDLLATGKARHAEAQRIADALGPRDVALLHYTSGSTAFPKGARLSHGGAARMAFWLGEHFGLVPEDRYFVCNPICHAGGTVFSFLPAMSHASTFLTLPSFKADDAVRVLTAERVNVQHGIDSHYWLELEDPAFDATKLDLRLCSVAGLVNSLPRAHEALRPKVTFSMYGATEQGGGPVCGHHADPARKLLSTHGRALPGVDLAIVDPATERELPAGEHGEIRIGGWSVMLDYYRQPEQTEAAFDSKRRLKSGDRGFVDDEGYLTFLGRIKNVLRVGGEMVAPEELEQVMQSHEAVVQAVVVGAPDERLSEVPVAYIVLKPGASLDNAELAAFCKERLASFKIPRYFEQVAAEDLPMTESGKVHRATLAQRFLEKLTA
jgi:fatty-acyl-CoA synthase